MSDERTLPMVRLDRKAEFERLRGYIIQVQELAKKSSAPVFWRNDAGAVRNGTMTFVKTGNEVLGITAGHVADECLEAYSSNPNRSCQVGGAAFDVNGRFISRHSALDLATFRLSEPFVAAALGNCASVPSWPPRELAVGELVLFGGWPGTHRVEEEQSFDFYFVSFMGKLDGASPRQAGLQLRIRDSMLTGPTGLPEHADLGGWSGGPVFRIVEQPLVYLELAGIIFEYSEEYELALAHPLSLVRQDGTFVPSP